MNRQMNYKWPINLRQKFHNTKKKYKNKQTKTKTKLTKMYLIYKMHIKSKYQTLRKQITRNIA